MNLSKLLCWLFTTRYGNNHLRLIGSEFHETQRKEKKAELPSHIPYFACHEVGDEWLVVCHFPFNHSGIIITIFFLLKYPWDAQNVEEHEVDTPLIDFTKIRVICTHPQLRQRVKHKEKLAATRTSFFKSTNIKYTSKL